MATKINAKIIKRITFCGLAHISLFAVANKNAANNAMITTSPKQKTKCVLCHKYKYVVAGNKQNQPEKRKRKISLFR